MEKEETDSRSPYLQSLPVEKEVRVHQIKIKLASCHQDGKTIFDYYGRFCYLWDQLQLYRPLPVCCCPAQYEISKDREREQLHHFLMGLDARYGCLCTHLLGMDPLPSLGEAYSKVVSEEQKLSSNPTHEEQAAVRFVTPSLATAPSSCQQSDSSVLGEAYSSVSKETSPSDSAGLLVHRSSKMGKELDLHSSYSEVVSEEQKLSSNPTHEQQADVRFVTPSLATAPSSCQQSDSSVLGETYSKVSKETSPSDSAGLLVHRSSKMGKELDLHSSYSEVASEEQKLSSNPTHEQQADVGFVTPSLATAPSSCQQSDSSVLGETYSKVSKETSDEYTGEKGTVRREKKAVHKTTTTDDKRLQSTLKRVGVDSIPAIDVNIFKDDDVIQFIHPEVQVSLAANTWVVSGTPQTKKLKDILPQIIDQLGRDNLDSLKKIAEQIQYPTPGVDSLVKKVLAIEVYVRESLKKRDLSSAPV